jgi:hypothetical protein
MCVSAPTVERRCEHRIGRRITMTTVSRVVDAPDAEFISRPTTMETRIAAFHTSGAWH